MGTSQFYLTNPATTTSNPSFLFPIKTTPHLKLQHPSSRIGRIAALQHSKRPIILQSKEKECLLPQVVSQESKYLDGYADSSSSSSRRVVLVGAVSIGFVMLLMGLDDQKALAFGPEGPLVEEFWENVRRYALYALTVSTGALSVVFVPIFELMKNPISALLLLVIFGGSFYIMSQVLSAMIGVNEFSYEYSY